MKDKPWDTLFRATKSILSYFKLNFLQTVKWETWNCTSITKQESIDFSLSLDLSSEELKGETLEVQTLLKNHFVEEHLSDEVYNGYFWSYWNKNVEKANLSLKLDDELPPIIMVTLNRFFYDKKLKRK